MASGKVIPWLRGFMLVCIFMLSAATIVWVSSPSVKAPLLTMMGGVTIVMTLYPPQVFTMQNAGTLLGTGIAIFGGAYWMFGEMENAPVVDLPLVSYLAFFLLALLIVYVFVTTLIVINWDVVKRQWGE